MSDTESNNTDIEEINESVDIIPDGEPTKSIQKPKKPRTEKQKEALKRAQIKRAENIEIRKKQKEELKLQKQQEKLDMKKSKLKSSNAEEEYSREIEENKEMLRKMALSKSTAKKPKKKKEPTIIYESDSSSSEEEVVIVKKKPRKKKKPVKKKVVYEESSSSSEEEEEITKSLQKQNTETYYEPEPAPEPRRKLNYSDVFKFQ